MPESIPSSVGVESRSPRDASRRSFLRLAVLGLTGASAVALAACAGAPSPTPPPAAQATQPPAKPVAEPTAPPAKPAAQPTAAPKPTQAPAKVTPVTLKIGTPTFQFTNIPIHMAILKGFFREQQIDAEVLTMDSTATVMKAVLAKEVHLGEMDASAQVAAIATGANARIIGLIRSTHHYMVAAKKEINSLKDLIGKNVAVSQPGSAPNIVLDLLFRAENIDPTSMNLVAVGGSANRAKALIAGTVDATVFGVDEMDKIESDPDTKMLLLVKDVLPNFVSGSLIMHGEMLAQPGVAERTMEALIKATRFCFENKDACVDLAVEQTGNTPESAARTWDFFTKTPMWEPNGLLTPEQVDYLQEVNIFLKAQDKKIPFDQIVDQSGAEKVIARLGKYTPKS